MESRHIHNHQQSALHAYRISHLPTNVEPLILASCETGLGHLEGLAMNAFFKGVTAAVCLSASVGVTTPTFAYKLLGWDWSYQANPITTQFVFCNKGAPSGAAQVIKNAAAKWNYAKFSFRFAADSCPATTPDNYIEFGALKDPSKTAESSHPNEPATTRMKKCSIRFNVAKKWNVSDDPPASTQTDLMSTALHEFGHCVGLDDLEMSGAVMSGILQPGEMMRELTADDLSGRNKIYGPP